MTLAPVLPKGANAPVPLGILHVAVAWSPTRPEEPVTALVFGELYRRSGGWRFRAVAQGWDSGLAGLARGYGIDVRDDPPRDPPHDQTQQAPEDRARDAPAPAPRPPAAPAPTSSRTRGTWRPC